jgi:hypothetical protein
MSYTKDEINPPCGCIFNINCTLHKSAPDMYEALKAIIAKRTECHESETAYIPPEIELAYKAIEKSEGH